MPTITLIESKARNPKTNTLWDVVYYNCPETGEKITKYCEWSWKERNRLKKEFELKGYTVITKSKRGIWG